MFIEQWPFSPVLLDKEQEPLMSLMIRLILQRVIERAGDEARSPSVLFSCSRYIGSFCRVGKLSLFTGVLMLRRNSNAVIKWSTSLAWL